MQRLVNITLNGRHCALRAKESLLELGDKIGFGCRAGACGSCLIKVIEGKTNLSSIDENEKMLLEMIDVDPSDYRLACQCRIYGDVTIESCNC